MFDEGSATMGPFSLSKVDPLVVDPPPVIGSPTRFQVKPSSSERWTCTVVLEPESWYEIQTCEAREVIHWRSACVVSMIWAVQSAKLFDVSAFGHASADTPSFEPLSMKIR